MRVGLYKSTDCGSTWFETNNNLPRDPNYFAVTGLEINPFNSNELIISSFNNGVFISYNGGLNWNPFSDGLQYLQYDPADIKINPIDTSKIIMSTYGASVWSIHRTLNGIENNEPVLPGNITLSSYPNPFNAQTTISYSLPKASDITLEIFDMAGRKVKTLLSGYQEAGEHKAVWDAKDVASGIYFYRIRAGESTSIKKCILLR